MKSKFSLYKTIFCVLIAMVSTFANAQTTKTLTGKVYDEQGALEGVAVRITKTRAGVLTDSKGHYKLEVPTNIETYISFTMMGKKGVQVKYKGQKKIDISLKNNTKTLKAMVIKARANINELDVRARTGTIAEADMQRLKAKPAATLALALQGNIPGLQVINKGELGVKPQIRIRGTSSFRKGDLPNEPLYILDGQVISSETFFNLNPEDIKEIKVLKDAASTALYGTKAANGVLEISSNRGFNGRRTISYSTKMGLTFRGEQTVDMMKTAEKLELERRLENPATPGYFNSEKYIRSTFPYAKNLNELIAKGAYRLDSLSKIETNWYDKLLRNNLYQTHNVSLRDGNDETTYYLGFGFTQQGGQIQGNDYKRFSGRIGLDQKFSDRLIVGISASGNMSITNTPNGSTYSPIDLIYKLNPYETEDSKTLISYPKRSYKDLFNQYKKLSTDKTLNFSGNVNYNVIDGLEIAAVGGVDFLLNEDMAITPPTAFSEVHSGKPLDELGKLSQFKNTTTNITYNVRATYSKNTENHSITLGANTDYYSTIYDNVGISGNGLFGNVMSGAAIDNSITGSNRARVYARKETTRTIGVGALAGYTYAGIYDIFATYKLDASSILPKKKRNNTAWAVGLGWEIKQYPFLKNVDWLTSLKLRASYGYTANLQGVSPENTISTFEFSPAGYDRVRILRMKALANESLRAEQNEVFDYGIRAATDYTSFDLSFYKRTTTDALVEVPIASSNGFTSQLQNVGILENSGVDASITQYLIKNDDWRSSIRLTMSYNKNRVVSLYGKQRLYSSAESILPDYEVGKPIDALYGTNSQGINPITGLPTFLTAEGKEVLPTYKLKREDYIMLGLGTPPISGSLYYQFSYKNFELDLDMYYTLGGKRAYGYNYVRRFSNANYNAIRNQTEYMWFRPGDDNKLYYSPYEFSGTISNLSSPSSRTVGSTNMLRLSSVNMRYRLSSELVDSWNLPIQFAYIGVQAANLYTFKSYKESDPESGSIVAPLQPVLTISLNVSF